LASVDIGPGTFPSEGNGQRPEGAPADAAAVSQSFAARNGLKQWPEVVTAHALFAMKQILECVPNFSEGRDERTIAAIADAMRRVPGAYVLHVVE